MRRMQKRLPAFAAAALMAAGFLPAPASAEERWLEAKSEHFRVYTNGSEKDGRTVLTGFETLRRLFQSLGDFRVDPGIPIVIIAARDQGTMRSFFPWFWERRGGVHPAGLFTGGRDKDLIAVDLGVPEEYRDDVVYHEYVHLITHLNFGGLPLWLNEGLAEFYAGTTVMGDRVVYGRVSRELGYLRGHTPLPLAQLFAIDGGSREYNESSRSSILYAESAVLTHYLLVGDKGANREKLITYLRLRGEGASDEAAQKQAFGDLKALQGKFFGYLQRPIFMAATAPLDPASTKATARPLSEAEALAVRGDALAGYGHPSAPALLAKARTLDPQLALAARALGQFEAVTGQGEAARKDLAEATRLAPDDFLSHYLLGDALAGPGASAADLAAGAAALQRARELNPSFAPASALLSEVLYRSGQLHAAFLALDRACTLEPQNVAHWARRADLLRELKRPDVAEKIEAQLAQTAPNDPEQLAALASYYHSRQRPDDLERLLRQAAALNPHRAQPFLMLASQFRDAKRIDDAEAAYRSALAAQPDNPRILNELAYLNADRGTKLPEALELIERALKAYPDVPGYVDTRAWTLFKMGRLDEAEKQMRRALEKSQDADILGHLGDVLEKRGQKGPAEEAWRRALEQADASEELKGRLRAKLGLAAAPADPPSPAAAKD